ncbi:LacI family DNA-binding transcriptional regulator [Agromyces neolithicus]|uniref:LacI family DNA-binding transcriptional regulator n=1 Tax=Agromyces neolithicus TaxID=269420 RepID=A0ABN2LZI6_9MICO
MTTRVKVGIRTVAAEAGVSTATVSQVYNNKGEVAEATRARVLAVGARLGYRPDRIGQALRSGRSRVIGVVVSYRDSAVWEQTYMPYYRSIIAGAAIEAVEHGYSISAAPSSPSGDLETQVPLDGVIVVDPVPHDAIVEQSLANGLAVVTDGGYETTDAAARLRSVRSDMAQSVPAMLDHLDAASGGGLRPALFIGPRHDSYTDDTIAAYRRWCSEHDVPEAISALAVGETPVDAAGRLLDGAGDRIDAVHCLNETYSSALLAAAAERGIRVPDELQVSVAGDARGVGVDPRISYLHLDPVHSGALCARTLIAMLEAREVHDVVESVTVVPAGVHVGGDVGAP